ncbi:MAG: right-handed parallel beta-helix repeat-containing protein [Chitinivibrionales bacterium]|nr:right-handed parallel beta-helix repeat-containing protein [Chitinivibrionales bacterium]
MVSITECICLFIIVVQLSTMQAATVKSGVLQRNEYWTVDKSPYIITNDLLIPPLVQLVITPGVEIRIEQPTTLIPDIEQHDHRDSFTVAITILGSLKCIGKKERRITFVAEKSLSKTCNWYGIVINTTRKKDVEIAFTDITSACSAISVYNGDCLIRNCLIEFSAIGIFCTNITRPQIFNNIIAFSTVAAIQIQQANPRIVNNILYANGDLGIWSDNLSQVWVAYNCLSGNLKNFSGCDPSLGVLVQSKKEKGPPHDESNNIFVDPIFAATTADSAAIEADIALPTDKSRIKDTIIAKVLHDTLRDSSAYKQKYFHPHKRYGLSTYSPCINAGSPEKRFKDSDGSRNDIGLFGGPEILENTD